MMKTATLTRPRQGRIIGGVCAAIAQRFDMRPKTVRLLALLSCLLPGPQFVLYLVLWVMLPEESA
jgi:phage shock protein PspC (stress-responsive transcriptional regulator)